MEWYTPGPKPARRELTRAGGSVTGRPTTPPLAPPEAASKTACAGVGMVFQRGTGVRLRSGSSSAPTLTSSTSPSSCSTSEMDARDAFFACLLPPLPCEDACFRDAVDAFALPALFRPEFAYDAAELPSGRVVLPSPNSSRKRSRRLSAALMVDM